LLLRLRLRIRKLPALLPRFLAAVTSPAVAPSLREVLEDHRCNITLTQSSLYQRPLALPRAGDLLCLLHSVHRAWVVRTEPVNTELGVLRPPCRFLPESTTQNHSVVVIG